MDVAKCKQSTLSVSDSPREILLEKSIEILSPLSISGIPDKELEGGWRWKK